MMNSIINVWKVNMKEKINITSNGTGKQKEQYQKKVIWMLSDFDNIINHMQLLWMWVSYNY